jgi:hypothetical protein
MLTIGAKRDIIKVGIFKTDSSDPRRTAEIGKTKRG